MHLGIASCICRRLNLAIAMWFGILMRNHASFSSLPTIHELYVIGPSARPKNYEAGVKGGVGL